VSFIARAAAGTIFNEGYFMKTLGSLCILLALTVLRPAAGPAQAQDEPLFTSEIGVQMYSFRNVIPEIGIESVLDMIRDMGITEIEGGPPRGMSPESFRRMCEARGLRIPSTGAGYEQLATDVEAIAERAKALGATYVMTAWIPHEVGSFGIEHARQAVEVFNAAGKALREHGLTFTYHFHGYELSRHGDGTLLDYIVRNTNPEYVSFQMDIFWAHFGGGDVPQILLQYGDRFRTMHLKDMKPGIEKDLTGLTDDDHNVVLGTGELDMPAILRAAKEVGIEHYFLEDESSRVLDQLPRSIEYLRGLR
jgi:sugar phosphate isomerase/epimerase